MAQYKKLTLLKVSIIVFALLTLVYGIGYLFFPLSLVKMSGGEPIPTGWLRWSGGVLLSLTIGSILVYRNLKNQESLVITFALGTLFSGLALLYNLLFEITGNIWFTIIPIIFTLISSALLWWGWYQAKDILKGRFSETE
jgi:hypothetical protein